MSIESILKDFVSSKEPGAIVLSGRWGVGKTYFWQHRIANDLLAKPWKKRYSYVSLFGINSLADLRVALAVATEEFDRDARNHKRLSKGITKWLWRSWKWGADLLSVVPRTGAGLSKLFDRVGFHLVRDRIICFDDIERHGSQLDLKDFLGLVSYLTEQRSCHVVVILNSGQLERQEQEVWNRHLEKVFYGELKFDPSLEQTIDLGLDDASGTQWHEFLRPALEELRISNIRLVRRAARFMSIAVASVDGLLLRDDTIERMARVVAMLVLSIHGRGDGGPPLDRIKRQGFFDSPVFRGQGDDQRTNEEKEWDHLIRKYGLYLHGSMDNALLSMIEAGFPEMETLKSAIGEFESNADLHSKKDAWHAAWRLYHDTVIDNEDAIIEAFERAWPDVSESEHAANLQSTASLLRTLGRSDLATSFIKEWVRQRNGVRIGELDTRELRQFRKVDDKELLAAAEDAIAKGQRSLTTRDAFNLMSTSDGYPEAAIAALSAAEIQDLVEVIDTTVAEDLAPTIRRILELGGDPDKPAWMGASRNMRKCCELIAARSNLAADRMKNWFGIDPQQT